MPRQKNALENKRRRKIALFRRAFARVARRFDEKNRATEAVTAWASRFKGVWRAYQRPSARSPDAGRARTLV